MPHRRATTLAAIILGTPKVSGAARTRIKNELDEIVKVRGLYPTERRRLLQLLHAMRAFDSSLAAIATYYGCTPPRPSMGAYLVAFANLGGVPFTGTDQRYYQARLVRRRNALMHEADNYPAGDQEVIGQITLMYGCVSRIL